MARIPDVEIAEAAKEAGFSGRDLEIAVALVWPESSGDPRKIGDFGSSFGLWQIHKPAHPELFTGGNDWTDPKANARMAKAVHAKQGFIAWTAYKTNAWRLFEGRAKKAIEQAGGSVLEKNFPAVQGLTDPLAATADSVKQVAGFLSQGRNWGRIGMIVIGGLLLSIAAAVLARPIVEPAVKTASKVITKGAV
jgi:hypothetical protein